MGLLGNLGQGIGKGHIGQRQLDFLARIDAPVEQNGNSLRLGQALQSGPQTHFRPRQ
jgi:hypothetical protein